MKKIPDNAKKVFEGIIFDVYHWEQEMFDGSFATFEALRRKDSVTVVAVADGKIVINKEEQPGRLSFVACPGGQIDGSDTPQESAMRELLEETALASRDWQEWFTADPWGTHKVEWNNYYFISRNCELVGKQSLDNGEKIEVTRVTFDEFLDLRHNKDFRNKDLIPILEKAATNEEEKQKLKILLGITT
jgi:ADP-ribose pyrophosphatase